MPTLPQRFETPNAVMLAYASRELTNSELALWRADMAGGASGPLHTVDAEQVLVVIAGEIEACVDDDRHVLGEGGSIVLPAGAQRQIHNRRSAPAAFLAASRSGAMASTEDRRDVVIPWAA